MTVMRRISSPRRKKQFELQSPNQHQIAVDRTTDGKLLFAKNLPRVARVDAREAEGAQLRIEQQKQELFQRVHLKYPQCRSTVFVPSGFEQTSVVDGNKCPLGQLQLEFIHGYHNTHFQPHASSSSVSSSAGNDNSTSTSTNNIFHLASGELVYYTSGVVVIYNQETHTQRFYISPFSHVRGSREVSAIAVHPDLNTVAVGHVGRHPAIHVIDCGVGSSSLKTSSKSSNHKGPHDSQNNHSPSLVTILGGADPSSSSATSSTTSSTSPHTVSIRCLDFSHDGKLLVSLGGDAYNMIHVWDWKSRRILASARGHSSQVFSIAFNPYQAMGIPDEEEPKPGQALLEDDAAYTLVSCGIRHIRFWSFHKVSFEAPKNSNHHTELDGSIAVRVCVVFGFLYNALTTHLCVNRTISTRLLPMNACGN